MKRLHFIFSSLVFGLTLVLGCITTLSGQPINNALGDIQMPSPLAGTLIRASETPVGSFTGAPAINIPIHTINDGPLSHSISLSHNTTGVRVAEVSSWVGMNWNLRAGGVITRTVMGKPDESVNGGYLNNSHLDLAKPANAYNVAVGSTDGEPDLFFFSAGPYNGKFIINGDIGKVMQYPSSDLTIEPTSKTLLEFIITTPDGTKYYFGHPTSTSGNYHGYTSYVGSAPDIQLTTPVDTLTTTTAFSSQINTGGRQRTEWYLRKIESSNQFHQIDFTYRSERYTTLLPATSSVSRLTYDNTTRRSVKEGGFELPHTVNGVSNLRANLQLFETSKLARISSPTTTVQFVPKSVGRLDVGHFNYNQGYTDLNVEAYALSHILIRPGQGNAYCKRFGLQTGYVDSERNPSFAFQKRLYLQSVDQASCTGDSQRVPAHQFTY